MFRNIYMCFFIVHVGIIEAMEDLLQCLIKDAAAAKFQPIRVSAQNALGISAVNIQNSF